MNRASSQGCENPLKNATAMTITPGDEWAKDWQKLERFRQAPRGPRRTDASQQKECGPDREGQRAEEDECANVLAQHTVQIKGDRHRELPPSGVTDQPGHCVRDPLGVTQKKEGEDRNENDHPGSESQGQDAREGN